jgi:protein-L-isoaspartate O-methyltransferase
MPTVLDPEGAHATAIRSLADLRGLQVLEIGCGDGRLTFELAGPSAAWHATEPKAMLVERARAALPTQLADHVTFAVAGGADVEAPEAEFDLVLFSWSL